MLPMALFLFNMMNLYGESPSRASVGAPLTEAQALSGPMGVFQGRSLMTGLPQNPKEFFTALQRHIANPSNHYQIKGHLTALDRVEFNKSGLDPFMSTSMSKGVAATCNAPPPFKGIWVYGSKHQYLQKIFLTKNV